MKSKLYLLFALLSLTAVFASPALAAPPVPTITNLSDGDVVNAIVPVSITTDAPADRVEVFGLGGISLGFADPILDTNNTMWMFVADLSDEDDTLSYPITVNATNVDDESSSKSVTVQLDKVPSPTPPFWMSPFEGGMELSGEINLRTITAAGIDFVEYFVDGVAVGQGVDTGEGGSSTWDYSLDLEHFTLGEHQLTAVAHEGDEFSVDSATSVHVVDGTMPVIEEILPAGETVSGTVQLVASITDNRGVESAEYSLDGDTWLPLVQSDLNETLWTASLDTTELPNGQFVLSVRAHDNNVNGWDADSFVMLDVQNPVVPVLDIDDVTFFGTLMADGPGIYAEGATATGFPEPDISYGWFVCETLVANCSFYDTPFWTPTAAQLGYTVRLVVRATNSAPMGSVSRNIMVGTVFAAPVDPPADPRVDVPVDSTVQLIPVKSAEVIKAEVKVVKAEKQVEEAKAEVKAEAKDLAVAKTVLKKAKKKAAAAKANVKEAKAEAKEEAKDVAQATTLVKKAKTAKKNAAKHALARQAKELASAQKEALAAAKAEDAAKLKLVAALKKIEAEQKANQAAQKQLEASQTELSNSQKELGAVKQA